MTNEELYNKYLSLSGQCKELYSEGRDHYLTDLELNAMSAYCLLENRRDETKGKEKWIPLWGTGYLSPYDIAILRQNKEKIIVKARKKMSSINSEWLPFEVSTTEGYGGKDFSSLSQVARFLRYGGTGKNRDHFSKFIEFGTSGNEYSFGFLNYADGTYVNVYHAGYGNTIYFEDFKELFVIDRDFRRMYLSGRKKVESAPDGLYKMNITMDYKGFITFTPLESDAVPGYEESPEKAHRHDSCWEDDFNCTSGYIVNPSLILYGDQISLADSEDKSYPWWEFSETDLYLLVTAIDSYRHRAIEPYGWKEIEDVPYNYKDVVLSRNVRILLDDWLKERDYRNRYNNIRYLPCQRMDREVTTAYYKSLKRNKN